MKHMNITKCLPITLTTIKEISNINMNYTTCKDVKRKYLQMIRSERKKCKNPCNVVEYSGRTQEFFGEGVEILKLIVSFVSEEIKVQEEYFIYSEVDLIGIVGGNLGLFIGFSFFDKIKQVISFVTNRLHN